MTDSLLDGASTFLWTQARLVDRRVFEVVFHGAAPISVTDAVRAYRNDDGGIGHALEADVRCPTSQPLFTEEALRLLHEAGARDAGLVAGMCEFLASVAGDEGAVAYLLPNALEYPRADHWNGDFAVAPSLHATSGVVGRLHQHGASHEWLDRATAWCFEGIERDPPDAVHRIKNAMLFLEHAPDRGRADALYESVVRRVFDAEWFIPRPPVTSYGLTPLHYAPRPDSAARAFFDDDDIAAHLDYLIEQQQPDGGWPIHWTPPGPAAVCEWRGRWTLEALLTLRAYGRL